MKIIWKFLLTVIAIMAFSVALLFSLQFADRSRLNFQKNLKQRATSKELHEWASQILAPYQENPDPALWIKITNLPPAFRGLDKWSPIAYAYADAEARFAAAEPAAYIKITYGSAAGHFGVIFGPTNLPAPPNREHEIRYTAWGPGAWFFDGQ